MGLVMLAGRVELPCACHALGASAVSGQLVGALLHGVHHDRRVACPLWRWWLACLRAST